MTENKKTITPEWVDPDDAPDLSTPEWLAKFDKADLYHGETLIRRGRPKLEEPKISTTIRLDADILEKFRAQGPKWQSRINDALREWLKKTG
jgi:uncharacterized protein (DUF4415 family)